MPIMIGNIPVRYDSRRNLCPALDVKVYNSLEDAEPGVWNRIRAELPEEVCDGFTPEWLSENLSDEEVGQWQNFVIEDELEQAITLAQQLFGDGAGVETDGRSGGWLLLTGLPDVFDWNKYVGLGDADSAWPLEPVSEELKGAQFQDGTTLDSDAGLSRRFEFFREAAALAIQGIPERTLDMIAHNAYVRIAEEKLAQEARERAECELRGMCVALAKAAMMSGQEPLVAYGTKVYTRLQDDFKARNETDSAFIDSLVLGAGLLNSDN